MLKALSVSFAFQGEAHKRRAVAKAEREKAAQSGRIPRISKLVALASRLRLRPSSIFLLFILQELS